MPGIETYLEKAHLQQVIRQESALRAAAQREVEVLETEMAALRPPAVAAGHCAI